MYRLHRGLGSNQAPLDVSRALPLHRHDRYISGRLTSVSGSVFSRVTTSYSENLIADVIFLLSLTDAIYLDSKIFFNNVCASLRNVDHKISIC